MKIDLEQEYQEWLKKMKLNESKMGEVQKRETKRAFFGGISSLIAVMAGNDLPDGETGEKIIESIMTQVAEYWSKELLGAFNQTLSMFVNEKTPKA